MNTIAFVLDTGCNLTPELIGKENILFVNLHIVFGSESFNTSDLSIKDFEAKAENAWPTTSGPSIGEYQTAYKKAIAAGFSHIFVIPISYGLSMSYSTAIQAWEMLEQNEREMITVLDVKTGLFAIGFLIEEIMVLWNKQPIHQEIKVFAERYHERVRMYLIFDTLEYLRRGGRISYMRNLLGSMLNIKPILRMNSEGKLSQFGKAHRFTQALSRVLEELKTLEGKVGKIAILHTGNIDTAARFRVQVRNTLNLPQNMIFMEEYGLVYYTHAGPNALGVCLVLK